MVRRPRAAGLPAPRTVRHRGGLPRIHVRHWP